MLEEWVAQYCPANAEPIAAVLLLIAFLMLCKMLYRVIFGD